MRGIEILEIMLTFSEERLALKPRWFTGQEWALGIAESEIRKEYRDAIRREQAIEAEKPNSQLIAEAKARKVKKFKKWFQNSVEKDTYGK